MPQLPALCLSVDNRLQVLIFLITAYKSPSSLSYKSFEMKVTPHQMKVDPSSLPFPIYCKGANTQPQPLS